MKQRDKGSAQTLGSLLPFAGGLRITQPPFELSCDSVGWFAEYCHHHDNKLQDGVGFFHMHEWLKERGIVSTHRVVWAGWRDVKLWVLAWALLWLFPFCKQTGMTEGFYGHA